MQRGRILAATTVERMVELAALNWKGDSSRLAGSKPLMIFRIAAGLTPDYARVLILQTSFTSVASREIFHASLPNW